jgi:spore germination protein KC
MKKHVGKLFRTAVCILCMVSLSGCWNSRELDTLGIVMGVGIDKPEGGGKVQITAQLIRPSGIGASQGSSATSGKGGSDTEAFWNVVNTGDTVFGVLRDMTNQSSRKLFFSHYDALIFGKSIAEEGVQEYIDFFARDPEPCNNVWVLVSQDSAGEILDVKSKLEKIPAVKIAEMVKDQAKYASQSSAVKLKEFVTRLMSKTTAPVATMIEVSGEGENKTVKITGTAVFKENKLVGKLDKFEGRGLLWALGEVKGTIIEVEDPNGSIVCLESIRSSGKIVPEIKDGRVIIKVNIIEEGNIGEYTGKESLSELSFISLLENKKSEAIRNEIMAAFKKAKELNADVFGFGDAVHQKYPDQWKSMEGNWDEIFQNIELEVTIDAKLRLTGRINNPSVPK